MDASANDACQWAELKDIIDTHLLLKLKGKMRASMTWVP